MLSGEELGIHLSMVPFADNEAAAAAGFVETQPLPEGESRTEDQLLLALDCEMCRTTKGVELTRITLVDAKENVRFIHEICNRGRSYYVSVLILLLL